MKIVFKEEQRFTQWWLWLILIGLALLPILGMYQQLYLGKAFGNRPMSDTGLGLFALLTFCFVGFFWRMRLKTTIDQKEIRMQFFPFTKKQVPWETIKTVKVVNYGFVGGWGIRLGTKYGTVYNIKGKMGLAITLTNGKKFLIGTQKIEELERLLKKFQTSTPTPTIPPADIKP